MAIAIYARLYYEMQRALEKMIFKILIATNVMQLPEGRDFNHKI
jgi:hypothetical protein